MSTFTKQASVEPGSNCGNKDCPRHGPNAMMNTIRKPTTSTSTLRSLHGDTNICNDKNCPRHGGIPASGATIKVNASDASSTKRGENMGSQIQSKEGFHIDVDGMVKKAQQMLQVSAPVSRAGGTNNIVTYITNNHNGTSSSTLSTLPISPNVSPIKERLISSGSTGMYDQMRMEHILKENAVLQSITAKQTDEIVQLQNQLKETVAKLEEAEQERDKLREKVKGFTKITKDWNNTLTESQNTIKNLKSKLYYTDLKAKQLKRMASENAATASKWRNKVMEALEAQKEMEERKNASEKAALGIYRQFRDEKMKIVDLKRQHGVPITDTDLDESCSSVGTLDTTVLRTPPTSATSGKF